MDDQIEQLLNGQHYKKFQEAVYASIITKYDLTLLELRILLFFQKHGSLNTANDIVKMHCLTKSNVSKAIDILIARDYLNREHDEQDRRYIHLRVQPKAEEVIEEAIQYQQQIKHIIFDGITTEELDVIQKVAEKITQNIGLAMEMEGNC